MVDYGFTLHYKVFLDRLVSSLWAYSPTNKALFDSRLNKSRVERGSARKITQEWLSTGNANSVMVR